LSDQRFAESYIADHRARAGSIKLAYDLRQRGVSDAIIEVVLVKATTANSSAPVKYGKGNSDLHPLTGSKRRRKCAFYKAGVWG